MCRCVHDERVLNSFLCQHWKKMWNAWTTVQGDIVAVIFAIIWHMPWGSASYMPLIVGPRSPTHETNVRWHRRYSTPSWENRTKEVVTWATSGLCYHYYNASLLTKMCRNNDQVPPPGLSWHVHVRHPWPPRSQKCWLVGMECGDRLTWDKHITL